MHFYMHVYAHVHTDPQVVDALIKSRADVNIATTTSLRTLSPRGKRERECSITPVCAQTRRIQQPKKGRNYIEAIAIQAVTI